MKEQILKHNAKLKTVTGKKAYLQRMLKEMQTDLATMQSLRHYPNPFYKDKPVTYDRTDQLYLDIEWLKENFDEIPALPF